MCLLVLGIAIRQNGDREIPTYNEEHVHSAVLHINGNFHAEEKEAFYEQHKAAAVRLPKGNCYCDG